MAQTEYLVIVEKYGPSSYGAYVPELPGIGVVPGKRRMRCMTWSPTRSGCISMSLSGMVIWRRIRLW